MAERTSTLQEPGHAKGSRRIAARLTDDSPGSDKGSQEGFASPKPGGDKIANKATPNFGKNLKLSPTPAMADVTHKFPESQMPWHAEETRASEDHRTVYTRGSKNWNNQGLLLPKPRGNRIANKVTTNKKMDGRVKNGKQLNAEGRSAILARLEQKRAWGKPPPKRGDVKKAIVESGVKKLIDTGKTFCCAPGPVDVDAIVRDLPFPTRSEPTATLWAKVEV